MGPKDGTPLPNEKRAKWMPQVFCQGFKGSVGFGVSTGCCLRLLSWALGLSSEISYFQLPKQQTHPFHKASDWGNESNLHLPLKFFVQLQQNMNQHCPGRQANQWVQWGFNPLEFYISKWLPMQKIGRYMLNQFISPVISQVFSSKMLLKGLGKSRCNFVVNSWLM